MKTVLRPQHFGYIEPMPTWDQSPDTTEESYNQYQTDLEEWNRKYAKLQAMKHQLKPKSQNKLILDELMAGKPLSGLLIIKKFGALNYKARISELRQNPNIPPIYGAMVEHAGKRYKVYYMWNCEHYVTNYGKKF